MISPWGTSRHLYKEVPWHPQTIVPPAVAEQRGSLPLSRFFSTVLAHPQPQQPKQLGQMFLFDEVDKASDIRLRFSSSWRKCPDSTPSCMSVCLRNEAIAIYLIFKVLSAEDFNLIIPELWPTTSGLGPWLPSLMKGCF